MNMQSNKGVGYDTGYRLTLEPIMAGLDMLEKGAENQWAGWAFPWHSENFQKAHTHTRSFVPNSVPPRINITDVWLTPSSAHDSFTTQMLGCVADFWHRNPEDNLNDTVRSKAGIISAARQVAEGFIKVTETGRSPASHRYPTQSMTPEIKKLHPPDDVKWLFIRAETKEFQYGCTDAELMIIDRTLKLVAHSHQVCLVIKNAKVLEPKNETGKGKLSFTVIG